MPRTDVFISSTFYDLMNRWTVSCILILCLLIGWGEFLASVAAESLTEVDGLLAEAADASPEEYAALRKRFLASAPLKAELKRTIAAKRDWKEQLVARIWSKWMVDPKTCTDLWSYRPSWNRLRNPFPRMRGEVMAHFEKEGETGLVIAMELMWKRGEARIATWYGALPALVSREKPRYCRELILELAVRNPDMHLAEALRQLGPEIAPEIHGRIEEANRRCLPSLISVLAHFKYEEALPKMGDLLNSLKKDLRNDWFEFDYYSESALGIAIVEAFQAVSGETFPGSAGSADEAAKQIDFAKKWWEKNASHYTKKKKTEERSEQENPPDKK